MNTRVLLFGLLLVVAAAAAVLSFAALRDLALVCGFSARLAWLLPITVDAGAAAGSIAWLSRAESTARVFGRNLALILLVSSVAGNAVGHALGAYGARPHWALVVAVSAVAPAVLGAVVHLAVLASRPAPMPEPDFVLNQDEALDDNGMSKMWETAPPAGEPAASSSPREEDEDGSTDDRVAELIASGAGRRQLARELGVSEHEARQLLARSRSNGQVTP